jgi:AcrR family transcriptional regulator
VSDRSQYKFIYGICSMRDGIQTRRKLERAALSLFVKKGVDATTIKDIARLANIAEGTLYRHYHSKDDLAKALYLNSYEAILKEMMALVISQSTIEKKIQVTIEFFCQKYDDDPILFNYLLLSQHSQINHIIAKEKSAYDFFLEMFKEAIKSKKLSNKDPQLYSAILLGIILQSAINRIYGRTTRTMSEDAQDLVSAVLKAIR